VLDYALAADLRRKRSRELNSSLVDLAHWLDPQDRALILSVLRDNLTAAEVAQARAVSPRLVRRRLRALISHMASPLYAYAAAHAPKWPDLRRAIATASILRVRSAREAARELNLTLHTVRTEVRIIQALAQQ
jgi:DNA-directed RNA polymerase specialized sigma24 family protein